MMNYSLTKTDVEILKQLSHKNHSISSLSRAIKKSIPWTSLSIKKLNRMEFVEKQRIGNTTIVQIRRNNLGNSTRKLFHEEQIMNLSEVISDSGLKILPLLLKPGITNQEITKRTKLSKSTVDHNLLKWRSMGLMIKNKKTNKYEINPKQLNLIEFFKNYSIQRNEIILRNHFTNGVIIWQWRDEFIFSIVGKINNSIFTEAGLSQLKEFDYNVISEYEYYFYSPIEDKVTLEEALIQSIKCDQKNPRVYEYLTESIQQDEVSIERIRNYARKYGLSRFLKKELQLW